jgi:hypothetical protein
MGGGITLVVGRLTGFRDTKRKEMIMSKRQKRDRFEAMIKGMKERLIDRGYRLRVSFTGGRRGQYQVVDGFDIVLAEGETPFEVLRRASNRIGEEEAIPAPLSSSTRDH